MIRLNKMLLLPLFALCSLLCSCGERVQGKLEKIDSLLANNNVDAAYLYLQALSPMLPDDNAETAYYTLLKTEILYRKQLPINSDSIDYSMFYYEQKGPKDKLARTYYYKGVVQFFYRDNVTSAIMLLKKAEHAAKDINDVVLKHKIYATISYINLLNKNNQTALSYAHEARELGFKTGNKMWIAYSLTYTANAYSGLGMPDSNLSYLLKSLQYYRYLSTENQSVLMANISDAYNQRRDSVKAAEYIRKALKERPDSYTYAILTDLYIQNGEHQKASELLRKALDSKDVYTQEKAMYNLFKLRQKTGDYRGAAKIADTLLMFKDKQQKEWQQNNIYEIQNRYDKVASEKQIHSYRIYIGCLLLVLFLSVTSLTLYHKYKVNRTKRHLLEKHLLISEYNTQLDEIKLSQSEANKELATLRQRVNNLKDKEIRVLSNGKMLYEKIIQNQNTVHWSSRDFLDFLEYYKFIDADYIVNLDAQYSSLSPRQYLFLIATGKMGKTETQIGDILAISPVSVRSIKSRIKSKHK